MIRDDKNYNVDIWLGLEKRIEELSENADDNMKEILKRTDVIEADNRKNYASIVFKDYLGENKRAENKKLIDEFFNTNSFIEVKKYRGHIDYKISKKGKIAYYYEIRFPVGDLFDNEYREFLNKNEWDCWVIKTDINNVPELKNILELSRYAGKFILISGKEDNNTGWKIKAGLWYKVRKYLEQNNKDFEIAQQFLKEYYRYCSNEWIDEDGNVHFQFERNSWGEHKNNPLYDDEQSWCFDEWSLEREPRKRELLIKTEEGLDDEVNPELEELPEEERMVRRIIYCLDSRAHRLGQINFKKNNPLMKKWDSISKEELLLSFSAEGDNGDIKGIGDCLEQIESWKDLREKIFETEEFKEVVERMENEFSELKNVNLKECLVLNTGIPLIMIDLNKLRTMLRKSLIG